MESHDDVVQNGKQYHERVGNGQRHLAISSIPELKRVSSRKQLSSFSLLDALDLDDRPTFVVDSQNPPQQHVPIELVYCNPALAANGELLATISETHNGSAMFSEIHSGFRSWLFGHEKAQQGGKAVSAYVFEGYIWSASAVDRFTLISGVHVPMTRTGRASSQSKPRAAFSTIDPRVLKEPRNLPIFVQGRLPSIPADTPIDRTHAPNTSPFTTKHGPYDYTLDAPPQNLSAHHQYFRSVDWANSSLGPMSTWCPQLRCVVNMILSDSNPAILFWGEDVNMIYNESYIELIGAIHPSMGQSAKIAASQYWIFFQPLVDHINATGETLSEDDMPLFLDRHGFLEETYFSFQFIPIVDSNGHIAGYYQPLIETTKNILLKRRVSSLVEIGGQMTKARGLETYWDLVLKALVVNSKDAPFALLYATDQDTGLVASTMSSPGSVSEIDRCILKGAIGVDTGHPIAEEAINFKDGTNIFIPYMLKAAKSRKPTLVYLEELIMQPNMLENIDWKGYGDPCRCMVICPILPTTGEQALGFLLLGVNPRRPFDPEYQQFITVMSRLLATSLASVVLLDDEIRQKENAIGQAARIQEQLLAQIKQKERKFTRWAEKSDIAIFIMDPIGKYSYRSDRWFQIFEIASDQADVVSVWDNIVFPEDIPTCEGFFKNLVVDKVAISFELKTKMRWVPPGGQAAEEGDDSQPYYKWILCSAYPEVDHNNELIEIVGNVTDISEQKWAEGVQKRGKDTALESKKHLEHFIDTTSHEMRNPLSAIMQCADGILSSYSSTNPDFIVPGICSNLLEQTLDAAQTIAQCAQHMKRIVDDILTISKLDSGLLVITPIEAQPESVAKHAVKMFEAEAKAAGVDMALVIEQSYRELAVNWVSLDPTRLLQILINLITNAVKFTRLEPTRKIVVSVSASLTEPPSIPGGVQFISDKLVAEDPHLKDDWKRGSLVFIQFSVSDTGPGLSEEEKSTLFARFSQASPRTHIHYGGSGLGLFISRRLTELQGGSIGLASECKKGSKFSFYIKARRTTSALGRRGSIIPPYPEDIKHRPHGPNGNDRVQSPTKPPPMIRKQSAIQTAIHTDIPSEVLGVNTEESFEELKRTKSVPDVLHVLVVEDNLVNQKVLAKQLRNLGCVVSVANHGGEALEFLKKTQHWNHASTPSSIRSSQHVTSTESPATTNHLPFDLSLILMDWEMPIMNGLTATIEIRQLEREGMLLSHVPVIGVTANVRQQQIETAMEAGMDDVVGKPFRVTELLGRMKGVVAGVIEDGGRVGGGGLVRIREGEG